MSNTNWKAIFFLTLIVSTLLLGALYYRVNLREQKPDYYFEQFDGSISYYKWESTGNSDIKVARLLYIYDITSDETRLPNPEEIKQDRYLPQSPLR